MKDSPELKIPQLGEIVEGTVVTVSKNMILVDIGGINTGIISGRETTGSLSSTKDIEIGDPIEAILVEEENNDGLLVLSLRKASQQKVWDNFVDAYENRCG